MHNYAFTRLFLKHLWYYFYAKSSLIDECIRILKQHNITAFGRAQLCSGKFEVISVKFLSKNLLKKTQGMQNGGKNKT